MELLFKIFLFLIIFNKILLQNNNTINNSIPNSFMYYDYCNMKESEIVYYIFQDVIEYFNITKNSDNINSINNNINNNQCLIISNEFNSYIKLFISFITSNKNSFNNYQCGICSKKFKTYNLFNLHYKLFHFSKNLTEFICPSDYCKSVGCDRYYKFFNIKKDEEIDYKNEKYNRQPKVKKQKCSPVLIPFYKDTCMKLIYNCFNNKDDYYIYYNYICNQITCNLSYDNLLLGESSVVDVVRMVAMYIIGILSFIYLIVIWLVKYT